MGVWFLKEHVTGKEKIGMFIALLGTIFITFGPVVLFGTNGPMLSGNLLLFGYLFASALSMILTKKLLKDGESPLVMTNITFLSGFLTTLPLIFIFGDPHASLSSILNLKPQFHLGVIYMALMSGVLAYYFNNKGQKSIEAGEASVFNYLYPLVELPIAVLWLGEKITILFVIGGFITLVGVLLAEIKKPRLAKSKR
jgi:drug/metabolite transporter (DMT)-like permease